MIRILTLTAHDTLRRRVASQPFCELCAAPLCLSRAVSVENPEGRKWLVCGACFDEVEMVKWRETRGGCTVLDGRKLFERNKRGGK